MRLLYTDSQETDSLNIKQLISWLDTAWHEQEIETVIQSVDIATWVKLFK